MSHLRAVPSAYSPVRRDLAAPPAIIYLPTGLPAAARWRDACGEYCTRKGYELVSVVTSWTDVIRMVGDGLVDVVVVGRRDHLAANRRPRVEIVTEQPADSPSALRRPQRRARAAG